MAESGPFSKRADREGEKQIQGLNRKFVYFLPKRLGTERSETRRESHSPRLLSQGEKKANRTLLSYPTQHSLVSALPTTHWCR